MKPEQLQKFYNMAEPRSEEAIRKAEERKTKRKDKELLLQDLCARLPYTDIEQSKKLAEILPVESADMGWNVFADNSVRCLPINDWDLNKDGSNGVKFIPCWSLAALLDVYPMVVGKDLDMYCCWQNSKNLCSKHYDNPVDAVVELIMKLHEQKLI